MEKGILYGVGVGPGDPELVTMKAVRILQSADVIAVPASGASRKAALDIVQTWVEGKPLLDCEAPMTRDEARLAESRTRVTKLLTDLMDEGKTVAFITLGDPSVYSTYAYLHRRVQAQGYDARMIAGVPSFCAAAAALGVPLCEGGEALHIIPASYDCDGLSLSGSKVLMKAGKSILAVRDGLAREGKLSNAAMVSCCGMAQEKIYRSLADLTEETSYFSVILVKEKPL